VKTEVSECLLSFGAESFVSGLVSKNIKIKVPRIIICLLFCMGVNLDR